MYYIIKGNRRHRYISFQVELAKESDSLTQTELIQALRQHTYYLFSKSTKEFGLWIIQFDGTTGIIRCNHKDKEQTIQLLRSLKYIGSKSVSLKPIITSGTIKKLLRLKN